MKEFPYKPQGSLGYLTYSVSRLISSRLKKEFGRAGLNLSAEHWGVLMQIWRQARVGAEELTQEELAANLGLEKSSLSRLLDNMEKRGLVQRRKDPRDGRAKRVYPTAKAEALREPSWVLAAGVISGLQGSVNAADMETCLKVLGQVQKALRSDKDEAI